MGLLILVPLAALAQGRCPSPAAAVTERFIDADCLHCWTAPVSAPAGWVFDWIVPSSRGNDAAMSAAALLEAQARQQRTQRATTPAVATPLRLTVASGPAWNGYLGVEWQLRGMARPGSTAWLALVELLPAGTEGSASPRSLLRSVAGPLTITGPRMLERLAMRWPEGARPERLVARAWIEDDQGRITRVAQERCLATLARAGAAPGRTGAPAVPAD